MSQLRTDQSASLNDSRRQQQVDQYSGEEALRVLKDQIYKYNSEEEREQLDELGKRLLDEGLLANLSIGELIDLYDRYSQQEEPLDSIAASLKHAVSEYSHDRIQVPSSQGAGANDSETSESNAETTASAPKNKTNISPELTCKVCLDRPVGMVLFPCSHLVTCVQCTTAMFECPVCRCNIKGTVNAIL